jgi:hypothetical protein
MPKENITTLFHGGTFTCLQSYLTQQQLGVHQMKCIGTARLQLHSQNLKDNTQPVQAARF